MPIYNAEDFLRSCLDSIKDQTYQQWELLAVNDGSSDHSAEILNNYAQSDSRIKVFEQEKLGITPALILGFQHASGDLICRMDADDLMPPNKLKLMAEASIKHGPGNLITGKVEYFSEVPLGAGYKKYAEWINNLVDNNSHFSQIYRECVIPSCVWMLHREDFINLKGFDADRYPEDYDLCFRFYEQQLKIISLKEVLHLWRDHPGRTSRNNPIYLDNRFLELKLFYFLKLEVGENGGLQLCGAGGKGKLIAQTLQKLEKPFEWITNNPRKIGVEIYGKKLISQEIVLDNEKSTGKLILALASPEDQKELRNTSLLKNTTEGKDYFFFA